MLSQKGRLLRLLRRYVIPQPLNRYMVNSQYQVELDLIRGVHSNPNTHQSILHFSVNKAATQYVRSILRRCATEEGMVPVHIYGYAFHTDFPYLADLSVDEMKMYQHIFRPRGYLYSVLSGMIEGIPSLEEYLTILMIRDPRDVLVSRYYSIAYSHPEPSKSGNKYKGFIKQRSYAKRVPIDEYVISESEKTHSVYRRYIDLLVERYPEYYLTRYEDMIADFPNWLQSLLNYCQIEPSDQLLNTLIKEQEKIPRKEDKYRHLRKGIAGDYRNKLEQQTIEALNSRFESVLETFGYVHS